MPCLFMTIHFLFSCTFVRTYQCSCQYFLVYVFLTHSLADLARLELVKKQREQAKLKREQEQAAAGNK